MDDKYKGNSFSLVKRENDGHSSHIYVIGGERGLNLEVERTRKQGFVVFDYRMVNQDAMFIIDDACRRANRGEEVDFQGILA